MCQGSLHQKWFFAILKKLFRTGIVQKSSGQLFTQTYFCILLQNITLFFCIILLRVCVGLYPAGNEMFKVSNKDTSVLIVTFEYVSVILFLLLTLQVMADLCTFSSSAALCKRSCWFTSSLFTYTVREKKINPLE